jgi:uncharacterized protein (TIGR03437 family)
LPALRLNFSASVSPSVFNAAVSNLDGAIPNLTDAEIVTTLAGIVALLNDPHTNLILPQAAFPMRYAPVKLQWFSDGLFVTGAAAAYARAAGARVTGIGSMSVDDAYQAVSTVISHENDPWLRYMTPQYLNNADVLEAVKVIPDASVVHMEFLGLDGVPFALDMPAVSSATLTAKAPDGTTGFVALHRRNGSQYYWSMWLDTLGVLYFKYSTCQNMPGAPFSQFAETLLAALDSNPVSDFVIDLRGNTGGDSTIINPLLTGLQQRASRFLGGVSLSVLADEGTISSAMLNAESLKGLGFATLIGAPTGGTPNHYGNIKSFTLPNSRLVVNYATQFLTSPIQTSSLYPDVTVEMASADFFARFDSVLAAATVPPANGPLTPTPASGAAIVNAADYRPAVAPGSIATAFGDFSALTTGNATTVPWPQSISGAQILVNGLAAPLLAVTPGQINFQVPIETPSEGLLSAEITANNIGIARANILSSAAAPGLFVASAVDVSRPGAILNADNGLNSSAHVARRGEMIQIYATGQGSTDIAVPDGMDTGTGPLARAVLPAQVVFGFEPGTVAYSGLSPALPGVWQINVTVPQKSSVSGQMPVYVTIGGVVSNAVTVWVEP